MATRTTTQGVSRSYGAPKENGVTPGVMVLSQTISFDSAQADAPVRVGADPASGPICKLPAGARVVGVMPIGAATANIDLGIASNPDLICDNQSLVTKNAVFPTHVGNTTFTQDEVIYGGVGSTAGTGTATVVITYIISDDGKESS